jgi:hypothetical protein
MLNVDLFLIIAAFVTTIASAIGKAPLWVPVLPIVLLEMLKLFGR